MKDDDGDKEKMTEIKDTDIGDKKNISVHHTGICLMQTDQSSAGLNLQNCVLLDSESTGNAFCNSNLLGDIWAQNQNYDFSWKRWNIDYKRNGHY